MTILDASLASFIAIPDPAPSIAPEPRLYRETTPIDASRILATLGQVAFDWNLVTDAISWSDQVNTVFAGLPATALASGAGFAALIEPSRSVRDEAVQRACAPDGVAYRIEYGVRASTSAPILWLEESGCCYSGADGRPARVQGVIRIDNERRARDEELLKLSRHDPLTGELNRSSLIAALAEAIEESVKFRSSFTFMLVGIDHLARINDAFGFDIADEAICQTAQRIRARLRGGDVLGRFSGNKFGVLLKNCSVDDTGIAAERFLQGIRDEVIPTRLGPVSVTASIGAVNVPRYARTLDEVMNRAQETLDLAKSRRHGSYSMWRPNVEREAQRRVNIRVTDEIVTALNERRIVTAFEPVVDACSRAPAFYECLVRMRQDDGRCLLAPDIVPVAEKLGLIRLVDHRVLELVVNELAEHPDVHLSLNISPDTTMDSDWWSSIETMMRAPLGGRAADRRDHRNRCDSGPRRRPRFRHAFEEFRQPDRDRRFRRGLHLVPQPAQARRRYRQDRRRLRTEHRAIRRRPRVRAVADRSVAPARHQDRRRMGAGRRVRGDAARLGLRLHPGPADRPRIVAAAMGGNAACDQPGCRVDHPA